MPRRPPVPLADPDATQLAAARVTFDDLGHVEGQWLNALADGQLAHGLRDEVFSHLATCDRCRNVVAGVAQEQTVRYEPAAATETALPITDLVGQLVGEYEVLEKLSEGGMGFVYRGVQPMIGKAVAIKVLQPEIAKDQDNAHRLLAEARAVNAIRHPNIVDVFAYGNLPDGRQYFVMELLTGQNLATIVRARPMQLLEVVTVLEQVTSALAAAHAGGVVHRDVKPSNIFVTPLSDGLHVTVLDFGVAKGVQAPLGAAITLPGAIIGTPGFMAPEQVRGTPPVGPPADMYALGCVAWLMLARREVFNAVADVDLMKMHVSDPTPSISSAVSVPRELAELIDSMLAKLPEGRPTAAEARRKLNRLRKELGVPAAELRRQRRAPDAAPTPIVLAQAVAARGSVTAAPAATVRELPVIEPGPSVTTPEMPSAVGPAPRRWWPVAVVTGLVTLGVGAALLWRFVL